MKKSFEGITKDMLENIRINNGIIYINYEDVADLNEVVSQRFSDEIEVEDNAENRAKICEAFDLMICWCEAYDGNGKEVKVEAFAVNYEVFYNWFDWHFGWDVITDGDE